MFKVYFSEFPLSKYGPLNENAMNEYWIWHTGLVVWNGLNNNTRNLACFTQWVTSLLEWEGSLKHYHSFAQVSWAILKVILQPWMVGINRGGWDTYLQRMSRDGAWGEWIALWGLVNTFSLPVALVSSLRERGLQIINPATNGDEGGDLTLWSCLDMKQKFTTIAWKPLKTLLQYGEGKVTEEICPKVWEKVMTFPRSLWRVKWHVAGTLWRQHPLQ